MQSVSQAVSGLPGGTTFHYRVSVQSDFGTFTGADQTFTTRCRRSTAAGRGRRLRARGAAEFASQGHSKPWHV